MSIQSMLSAERISAMKAKGLWRDRTLLSFFDETVRRTPERPALICHQVATGERVAITYRELADRARRIAAGLVRLGVEPGDIVSYQLPNWWHFTALHLACLRIGAVTNPLMPIFRERELGFMLSLAASKVMVVPKVFRDFDHAAMIERLRPQLPDLRHLIVVGGGGASDFDAVFADAGAAPAGGREPGPNDVIQVLYTSGTTGEPKGVMHTSNTLMSNLFPYAERLGMTAEDVTLMASPLAHQTGFMYGLMMPIVLGGTAVIQDIWNADKAAQVVADEGVTFTMASTPFLADITTTAERRPELFRSLRIFLAAGAPIPRVLARRAADSLGASVVSAWGMTENGAVTTTKLDDPPEKAFETDGCPMAGMELRIADGDGRFAPAGQEGRLYVRGCSNFVGYLKRPELYGTDAEGWFDTGDLGRLDADGYLRITGRAKDIIIRGGENIPVVEIEELLYKHPHLREVAIVGMPDERLGERACAFVVTDGDAITLPDIATYLREQGVAVQYTPERLEVVDALPRTPSGKIQKFKLREQAKSFG